MEKKPFSHITLGAVIGAILVLYTVILYLTDLWMVQGLSYLSYLFVLVGLIVGIYIYGKSVDNTASFGKLFTFGFKAAAILTLITLAFQVIFFNIFPEYIDKTYDFVRDQMVAEGKLDSEQIDQALVMVKKFFWVGLIGGSIFGLMFVGAISSLIGAAITKKNPQHQFAFQDQPLK